MLLVASNKLKQLLTVRFIGQVLPTELESARAELAAEIAGLLPDFRYLVDFTQFEAMNPDNVTEVGQLMELIAESEVSLVVRVIPDARHDIGMNILTIFHYPPELKVITFQTLTEAATALEFQ